MKKLKGLALALATLSLAVNAGDPNFSLHNKSGDAVEVEVYNLGKRIEETEFANGDFLDDIVNIDFPTSVDIVTDSFRYQYQIMAGRTVYINWDGKKLYPQRGPRMGWTGKTDLGYSLKNNVKDKDIRLLNKRPIS